MGVMPDARRRFGDLLLARASRAKGFTSYFLVHVARERSPVSGDPHIEEIYMRSLRFEGRQTLGMRFERMWVRDCPG